MISECGSDRGGRRGRQEVEIAAEVSITGTDRLFYLDQPWHPQYFAEMIGSG